MSHNIHTLSLTFNLPLRYEGIELFRKAICALGGKENDLFHNERLGGEADEKGKYIERYPLIQYQVHGGFASVIGINAGAEALAALEQGKKFSELRMGDLPARFRVQVTDRRQEKNFPIRLLKKNERAWYRIYGYVPLNTANYTAYKALDTMAEKLEMLEKLLTNHIVTFMYGAGWEIPGSQKVEARITDLDRVDKVTVLGVPMMGFDMAFSLNAELPDRIGLGRKTAFGFGWIFRKAGKDRL